MAKSFKIRIFNLLFEFLTHTLVLGCMLSAAWAVAARALETFFAYIDYLLVGIECDFHCSISVLAALKYYLQ